MTDSLRGDVVRRRVRFRSIGMGGQVQYAVDDAETFALLGQIHRGSLRVRRGVKPEVRWRAYDADGNPVRNPATDSGTWRTRDDAARALLSPE